MHLLEVLRRPIVTEKNTRLLAQNKYTFEVARAANKPQIKEAVEKAFKVRVAGVRVIQVPAKTRRFGRHLSRTPAWKKAVVTLAQGDKIELFEGV